MKNLIWILLLSASLVFQSCDNGVDPAMTQTEMTFKAVTSQNTINSNGRTEVTGLEFTSALLGVTEIEIEGPESEEVEDGEEESEEGEEEENEIEYEGEFVIDLLNGTSTPDLGVAELPAGNYTELEVEMSPILEDGNTLFLAFNFIPDGASDLVYVEYTNQSVLELEIEDPNGIVLEEGAISALIVQLDLDALFSNIDLSNATADEDGVIRINATSNTDLAYAIAANLANALEVGEDNDRDGDLDEDDDD